MPPRSGCEWPSDLTKCGAGNLKQFLKESTADSSVCVHNAKCRLELRIDVQKLTDFTIHSRSFGSEVVKNDDLNSVSRKKIEIPLYLFGVFCRFAIKQMLNHMFTWGRPATFLSILLGIQRLAEVFKVFNTMIVKRCMASVDHIDRIA